MMFQLCFPECSQLYFIKGLFKLLGLLSVIKTVKPSVRRRKPPFTTTSKAGKYHILQTGGSFAAVSMKGRITDRVFSKPETFKHPSKWDQTTRLKFKGSKWLWHLIFHLSPFCLATYRIKTIPQCITAALYSTDFDFLDYCGRLVCLISTAGTFTSLKSIELLLLCSNQRLILNPAHITHLPCCHSNCCDGSSKGQFFRIVHVHLHWTPNTDKSTRFGSVGNDAVYWVSVQMQREQLIPVNWSRCNTCSDPMMRSGAVAWAVIICKSVLLT